MALNLAPVGQGASLLPLDLSPSCSNVGAPLVPAASFSGRAIIQRVDCGGTQMNIEIEVFSPRSTAGPINAERRHLTRPAEADDISESPLATRTGDPLRPWRLIRANIPAYVAAAGIWIDGEPTMPGIAMRLKMARTSIFGGAGAPVLVVVTPIADWANVDMRQKEIIERQIASVMQAHPKIGDQINSIANPAQ
jgi:hypothetical protein